MPMANSSRSRPERFQLPRRQLPDSRSIVAEAAADHALLWALNSCLAKT
jgi:hypothetical protein